jgi:hypothetical protein
MARKARISKGKTMKPNFFVFCEGKTEIAYVAFLRAQYRVPIQIIPRKSDSNISDKYINRCKEDYVTTKQDQTFVMFDLDVAGMLDHLNQLSHVTLLVSNPCIEIWFLLHIEDCKTELSSEECVKRLLSHFKKYKKGILRDEEKTELIAHLSEAISRAKGLSPYGNPSSSIYQLIEAIKGHE